MRTIKRWIAGLALAGSSIFATETPSSLPELPAGIRWEKVEALSDEFEGKALDLQKWMPKQPYWKGRAPSEFAPANVSVRDGMLELRSTATVQRMSDVKNPEKDIWVKAACVASSKPIASYGYYETRMRASKLSMTSSFWFQGKYSEIDVVEQVGASLKNPGHGRLMLMNTHFFADGWKKDLATPKQWKMPSGSADDFHVYGVWWKDRETTWFYHDGEKVAELKTGGEFAEPMYMFFDTEVFLWEGLPTLESLGNPEKNAMRVDWVRAWRSVKE
ncbi:MAG: family 16 glycosylhydrolase [Tepidisphaeraceae bacterium]|jgi:beta-glucanase (GH16 family)